MTEQLTRKELLAEIIEMESVEDAVDGDIKEVSQTEEGSGKYLSKQAIYKFTYHFAGEDAPSETFVSEEKVVTNSGYWSDSELVDFNACYVTPEKELVPEHWVTVYKKVCND